MSLFAVNYFLTPSVGETVNICTGTVLAYFSLRHNNAIFSKNLIETQARICIKEVTVCFSHTYFFS